MTYSIVAYDGDEIGVAVETALPGVGRLCPWAEAGIGAVATQALVRTSHGTSGLMLMRNGHTAPQTLAGVLAVDPGANVRQIGMVDVNGNAAAYTGSNAIRYAGHHVGEGYSVQANMMATDTVPSAMSAAFEGTQGVLVLRILAALNAAQAEGGDFRGQQSAALKIVSTKLPEAHWEGVLYDVRVDDHPEPVKELERICHRFLAYQMADKASALIADGNVDGAMKHYHDAVTLDPSDLQFRFWFAIEIADQHGQFALAEPILREVFAKDPMWVECLTRYAEVNRLQTDGILEHLLALKA